jgi:hypothetical protein
MFQFFFRKNIVTIRKHCVYASLIVCVYLYKKEKKTTIRLENNFNI